MTVETVGMVAGRFKVLSDPMRLQILNELQNGERSVMQIVAELETSQPNVSKHLRLLQESGLVVRRQEGNSAYYAIADQSIFEMCDAVCGSLAKQAKEKVAALAGS